MNAEMTQMLARTDPGPPMRALLRCYWAPVLLKGFGTAFCAAIGLACALAAHAQATFPTKAVRIIVPFPAGGTADVLPRIVGERLSAQWGQPVIVENRVGAGGNIGADAVARAEPDGHTLLASPPGPLAINHHLYRKLTYDPTRFVPVSILAVVPNVLAARTKLPVTSVKELIAHARANPGKVTYASAGNGTTQHLTGSMFQAMAKIDMVHVPYKGSAPALADLMGEQVDIFFDNLASTLKLHQAGKIRILAVASPTRVPALPDVPTIAEVALPGFQSVTWFGVAAPEGTPTAVVQQLSVAIAETLKLPDVQKRFRDQGAEPVGGTPAEALAFIREESERWRRVIKEANVTLD